MSDVAKSLKELGSLMEATKPASSDPSKRIGSPKVGFYASVHPYFDMAVKKFGTKDLGTLVGVSRSSVQNYNNGHRRIPVMLELACQLLVGKDWKPDDDKLFYFFGKDSDKATDVIKTVAEGLGVNIKEINRP